MYILCLNNCKAVTKTYRVSSDPTDSKWTYSAKLFWGCDHINSNQAYTYGSFSVILSKHMA